MSINKASLADDGFKTAFLEGTLAIDCLEIKLTQKGATEPREFCATGFILVSAENGAEARMVIKRDHKSAPYDLFTNMSEALSVRSGELFPVSFFYRLEATDIAGNVWTNPSVRLINDHLINAEILSFTCDQIDVELTEEGTSDFAHFVFSDDLKFPLNMSMSSKEFIRGKEHITTKQTHSTGVVSGMQVFYHKCSAENGQRAFEMVAKAATGSHPPEGFEKRLLEAICFCSATMVSPVMTEVSREGKRVITLARAKPPNNGLVSPPLSDAGSAEDFYRLMGCYYDYACQNVTARGGAPLTAKLGGLFTLKGVWLDTIALLLCVATESVLDDPLFNALGKPNSNILCLIKELFDWVKKAPVEQGLRERALSAMGSMKSNRAVDKMHALVSAGAIDKNDIGSWKFLRNPSAHGNFVIADDELQNVLDHIHRLITLIYKLAFLKIRYTGKYSNYAQRGWFVCDYDAATHLDAIKKVT